MSTDDHSKQGEGLSNVADEEGMTPPPQKRRQMAGEDMVLNVPETTIEGQMKLNPHFSVEEARAAAKKEYNRRNSARSRVRSKKMVNQLQEECSRLRHRVNELVRENDVLRSQVDFYKRRVDEHSAQPNSVSSLLPPLGSSNLLAQQLLNRVGSAPLSIQQSTQLHNPLGQSDGSEFSFAASLYGSVSSIPSTRGNAARSFFTPGLQQQLGAGVSNQQQQVPYSSSASTAQLSPRSRALVLAMLEEQRQKSRNKR